MEIVRAEGVVAAEVCWFAHNEHGPYPQGLIAAWNPGDRDAVLHILWSDGTGRDEAKVSRLGELEVWLRRLLEQLLARDEGDATISTPHEAVLRSTLVEAAARRPPELQQPWLWGALARSNE
jgi:hypothetical protein